LLDDFCPGGKFALALSHGIHRRAFNAGTREHDAVRALDLGADDFLTKPFSPSELVARIRRRLRPAQVAPP